MDAPPEDPSNYENYWTPVWNHALKLKDSQLRVLIAIGTFADFKEGRCWPAVSTIAERAQCSVSTVRRAVKVLVEEGFLELERRSFCPGDDPIPNRSNKYWLVSPAYQGVNPDGGGVAAATVPPVMHESHNDNQEQNPNYLNPPFTISDFSQNQSWREEMEESNRGKGSNGESMRSLDEVLDGVMAEFLSREAKTRAIS